MFFGRSLNVSASGELGIIQLTVEPSGGDKGFVGALLYDVAAAHDDYQVCVLNGGKAVGYDKAGAALHHLLEGPLNKYLRAGVDR